MAPDIPKKMKAIQIMELNKPYEIHEVDVPTDLDPPGTDKSCQESDMSAILTRCRHSCKGGRCFPLPYRLQSPARHL